MPHPRTVSSIEAKTVFSDPVGDKPAFLKAAVGELPRVLIFDNDDLRIPFRNIAVFEEGRKV